VTDAYVCQAIRSPIGRLGGSLSSVRPDDLAAHVLRALAASAPQLDPARIDDVVLGCANQAGEDNRNVARMALLLAGLPVGVPGVTVNRLCASGAQAVVDAARAIRAGESHLVMAGGVESMSRSPYVMSKASTAFSRAQSMEDTTLGWRFVNPALQKAYGVASMPETAENVARRYDVSREDQDRFAESSQRKTAAAQSSGYHAAEIAPITVTAGKDSRSVDRDEHPRPDTDLPTLAKLRPVVTSDGSVTAGNASGLNDGAAAMFVASETGVAANGLIPAARVLGAASAGVEPDYMGIGPIAATRRLLSRLQLDISDFDLFEINEAFASQVIASMRELGVDPFDEAVNPHGGAIALGHPLGMSGARLVQTAAHGLKVTGGQRALVTMCIGVGQGLSIALEAV